MLSTVADVQLLRKANKGPQISDDELFTIDWKFKDK